LFFCERFFCARTVILSPSIPAPEL
jgi:hypothetical protein